MAARRSPRNFTKAIKDSLEGPVRTYYRGHGGAEIDTAGGVVALLKRGGFNADDMTRISAWTDEVLAMPEVSGRHWVYHERSRKDGGNVFVIKMRCIQHGHSSSVRFGHRIPPCKVEVTGNSCDSLCGAL